MEIEKKDVLTDLMTGKTNKCCYNCINYIISTDTLSQGMDGKCYLDKDKNFDESFCFSFEFCNRFQYKNLEDALNDFKCSECNSKYELTYYNGYLGLTCSNKNCWTHNLIYVDFEGY